MSVRCRELSLYGLFLAGSDLWFFLHFPPFSLEESIKYFLSIFGFTLIASVWGVLEVFRCYPFLPESEYRKMDYLFLFFTVLLIIPPSLGAGYYLNQLLNFR